MGSCFGTPSAPVNAKQTKSAQLTSSSSEQGSSNDPKCDMVSAALPASSEKQVNLVVLCKPIEKLMDDAEACEKAGDYKRAVEHLMDATMYANRSSLPVVYQRLARVYGKLGETANHERYNRLADSMARGS